MELNKLECSSCGAPINPDTGICEYCGSRYLIKKDPGFIPIMIEAPRIQRLRGSVCIPNEAICVMSEEKAAEYAINSLSYKLSEKLAEFMKIRTSNDYYNNALIVEGEIRLVPPDIRF